MWSTFITELLIHSDIFVTMFTIKLIFYIHCNREGNGPSFIGNFSILYLWHRKNTKKFKLANLTLLYIFFKLSSASFVVFL